jgi:hypothetical protein
LGVAGGAPPERATASLSATISSGVAIGMRGIVGTRLSPATIFAT